MTAPLPLAIQFMLRVEAAARAGVPVAADEAAFAEAVRAWWRSGVQLEAAIGARPAAGQRRPQTIIAAEKRDQVIKEIAKKFSVLPNDIADAMRRYERSWPRDKGLPECPKQYLGKIEEALFQLFKLGTRPLSPRQL